jgi:hypothetical protein
MTEGDATAKMLEIRSVRDPTEVMKTLVEQNEWGLLSLMGLRVEISWSESGSVLRFTGPPFMIDAMESMVEEWTVGVDEDLPSYIVPIVGEA